MSQSLYIDDIVAQPAALRSALLAFDHAHVENIAHWLRSQRFSRIVITGMGASLFAGYPAYLMLVERGWPVWLVEAGELLHFSRGLVTQQTLLWVISQSGRSAEVVNLLDQFGSNRPACILATTNDLASPLSMQADFTLPLNAEPESNVSTRTYTNSLAVTQLAASVFCRLPLASASQELELTATAAEAFLAHREHHVKNWDEWTSDIDRLMIVGRGPSMAAVQAGALILKEAARYPAEGMSAGQFRHGPLEIANKRLGVIILAGPPNTSPLNHRLMEELRAYHAKVCWIGSKEGVTGPKVTLPDVADIGQPVIEILPLQLLSVVLAQRAGIEPGVVVHGVKIVLTE